MKMRLFSSQHRLIKAGVAIGLIGLIRLISLILPPLAAAQTTSLSLWPPLLEVMVQPGKSVTQVYRLKNEGDDTAVQVSVVPFSAADEEGHINLQFGGKLPRFFSLLNADLPDLPVTLNLKAGQTQELVLKISIPAAAEEADYPAALVVESDPLGLLGGSGSTAKATVAVPILLTVSRTGTPQRLAKIEDFKTTRTVLVGNLRGLSLLDSFDPIEFILRVKNQSLTRLQPVGQIKISNTFGRKVATLPLQSDHILGGTVRQLKSVGTVPTDLIWKAVFPVGRYTATAEITPLDTTNTVSQAIVFWVLPYKALLILCLLFFGYRGLTRLLKQQKLKP